jgi:hypothetical protein
MNGHQFSKRAATALGAIFGDAARRARSEKEIAELKAFCLAFDKLCPSFCPARSCLDPLRSICMDPFTDNTEPDRDCSQSGS